MLAAPGDEAQLFAALRAGAGSATSRTDSSPLTSREWQVLDSLRQKKSTAEIAARLFVSQATVRSHVAWLLRKLGHVSGARAKARRAGRERLTTQEQPEGLRILAPRMVVAATEKRKSDE
jgi:DNA-binding NarL/FixJ family response regulator